MASPGLGGSAGADCADRRCSGGCAHCSASRSSGGGQQLMGVTIHVENLNAWYGKVQALHDINLKFEPNHATALIGPSGCGKSTFIRCLNRMHETNRKREWKAVYVLENLTLT